MFHLSDSCRFVWQKREFSRKTSINSAQKRSPVRKKFDRTQKAHLRDYLIRIISFVPFAIITPTIVQDSVGSAPD